MLLLAPVQTGWMINHIPLACWWIPSSIKLSAVDERVKRSMKQHVVVL